jgi:hypothetical protein
VEDTDYAAMQAATRGDDLVVLKDFNPSCRKVAFDCVLNRTRGEIYVVVRTKTTFLTTEPGGSTWPNSAAKDEARTAILLSPHLWNGHFQLRRTYRDITVDYQVKFFYNPDPGFNAWRVNLEIRPAAAPVVINNTVTVQCNAYVPTGTGYTSPIGAAGNGSSHSYTIGLTRYSGRCTPNVTNLAAAVVRNPASHEFGHLLGLPDEYLALPASWAASNDDGKRAAFLWTVALGDEAIPVPVGTGPANPANSIMNDIDIRPTGFHQRHFVTVLQAARRLATVNRIAGTWSLI